MFLKNGPECADEFTLAFPGKNGIPDYEQYGTFENIGTDDYRYVIEDRHALGLVSGSGVYPDWKTVLKDPAYERLKQEGRLSGNHWTHVDSGDPLADFFVWCRAPEEHGVKQFFIAQALEEAGLYMQAVKAYYAVIIFFPRSPCWGADRSFVWYVGPEAIQRIKQILNQRPEMLLSLHDAEITVENGKDTNLSNDIITVNPGRFVAVKGSDAASKTRLYPTETIVERRGSGMVRLVQYDNGLWQLMVNDQPFTVKGIHYAPTRIGLGPTELNQWMFEDTNENGMIDAPYESWVDINRNNRQDRMEKTMGDSVLLKQMGCNAIRIYHSSSIVEYHADEFNKKLLRDLHQRFGIWVVMGDFLGAYTIGSGANWDDGTDYTDPEQCATMKQNVYDMVMDHKDEPYVLFWVLGNENNMAPDYSGINATRTNAATYPEAYARFLNDVAAMIHRIDPNHPVAVGNLELDLIEYYERYAPELDILAINSYRGKRGFGTLWTDVSKIMNRPIVILEYGCDAYDQHKGLDEEAQKEYHEGCWNDIQAHMSGGYEPGNALGGIIFEWLDEWWKDTHSGDPYDQHQTHSDMRMPFPDGLSHEEWLGIAGQGNGEHSPFLRKLRATYYYYKKAWTQ
ncbi:MAG: hypothetical protein GF384_05185 [Elusimicrobia bacterium]|nr:hypothetical protein [Elusimicrobiota bacterium]